MKLKWKDFLYFQRNDRNAIILLLFLIVACGGFAIWNNALVFEKNALVQDQALAEFDKFQQGSTIPKTALNRQNKAESDTAKQKSKKTNNTPEKLSAGETIDLNGATNISLKRIPGIGDEYARRIMEYKNQLGGFTSPEQLKEIKGITAKRFDNIASYIIVKRKPKLIKINKCAKDELIKHPYINTKQIDAIMDMRLKKGKIAAFGELLENSEFTPRDTERLLGYLSFD